MFSWPFTVGTGGRSGAWATTAPVGAGGAAGGTTTAVLDAHAVYRMGSKAIKTRPPGAHFHTVCIGRSPSSTENETQRPESQDQNQRRISRRASEIVEKPRRGQFSATSASL